MSFWTDNKISDDFTPEDRYFYLYLFTNPHTNLCGCYEISIKQISNETGYSKDSVENLINRFEKVHKVLRFSKETKEVLLINWSKYNWTTSDKFRKPLYKEIENVKNSIFRAFLTDIFNGKDTVSIPYPYGSDTTVTVTDTITDNNIDIIKDIIDYLNSVLNTKYRHTTANTQKHIKARLSEGRTFEDFKTVIDKKAKEWKGTEMEKYLCPDTLFGSKFEKYLNQKITDDGSGGSSGGRSRQGFPKQNYDFDALEKELGI
jgi:uncharacterized phage protein (TIGR02220 family)